VFQSAIPLLSESTKKNTKKKISVTRILTQFEENLRNKSLHTSLINPEGGSTGYTFICTTPFARRPNQLRHFVLKWDFGIAGKNQQLCSDLLATFGFSTPKIRVIKGPIAGKIKKHAEKICPSFTREDYTLIYMRCFPAVTFSSAFKKGYLKDLKSRDWEWILTRCGRMMVMDLVTGNADRFFRTHWTRKKTVSKSHFNDGNLMLEMPFEKSMEKRFLKQIHFIDNATDPVLTKCFQKPELVSDDEEDFCLEVGRDLSSGRRSSREAKKTIPQETEAISDKPSHDSWKNTVKFLISNPNRLITAAANGICNSFKNEKFLLKKKKIKHLLKKGFKQEIQNIRDCNLSVIESTIRPKIFGDDVCLSTFQLMKENLKNIQEL
jgi:hypothetical protein